MRGKARSHDTKEGPMRRGTLRSVAVLAVLFGFGASDLRAEEPKGLAAEIKFCQQLEKAKPVEPKASFTVPPRKVYAWTLITGGKGSFTIHHLWFKNDKQVYKHPITVRGGRYPTWSFLMVSKGKYRVEVQDEAGKTINTGEFSVE
jgi:hypothetical protein